eukprot:gene7790-17318_t
MNGPSSKLNWIGVACLLRDSAVNMRIRRLAVLPSSLHFRNQWWYQARF